MTTSPWHCHLCSTARDIVTPLLSVSCDLWLTWFTFPISVTNAEWTNIYVHLDIVETKLLKSYFSPHNTQPNFFVWGDYWFHLSSVGKVQWTLWKVLWDEVNILWSSTWHHLTLTSQLHRIFINIRTLVKCCQCACVKVFMWNKLIKYPKWMFHLNIFMTNWKQSRNPLELSFTNIALNLGSRF